MGLSFRKSGVRKRDQILAIDLGGRMTKAVQLQRKGDRLTLTNYAILDAASHDKAISPDVLAEHLKEIVRLLGVRAKHVSLALGVNDAVFKQTEVPLLAPADLRQMLKYNTKNYLQQDLQDYVFDCHYVLSGQPAPSADGTKSTVNASQKQKALIGGAKRQTIDDVSAAIRAAGLIPEEVVPGITGPVNAFELADPTAFAHEVIALVEIGFKNTTIIILSAGEILLNRVVAIGGDQFTQGLADQLGTSYQEAENIKVGMAAEVQQNLEPLIQPLGRELRASIDFFEHQQDKTVGKVFIAGGSARSEFVVQSLQSELMVPCQAWSPLKCIDLALPPEKLGDIDLVAPQLTVAVGTGAASF
jgi:type IV pilus assembly protein PilM